MSKCWHCGTEFTLTQGEQRCDTCGRIVTFHCHNCHQWFDVVDAEQCSACGYFPCKFCGVCGEYCPKDDWAIAIKEIIPTITNEQLKDMLELIEEIKLSHEQKSCPKGVPVTYAKSRIKSCLARMNGYRTKGKGDIEAFKRRVDEMTDKDIGSKFTINQIREKGSYGQEYRDVFNFLVCAGKLMIVKMTKTEGDKTIEYDLFERCESSPCPQFDVKDLLMMECSKCHKKYPLDLNTTTCCFYKNAKKKGQPYQMKLSLNNKDTCQLPRREFKKEGENGEDKY